MSQQSCERAATAARELLAAARGRLPWLKRVGVLPGGCPDGREVWQSEFQSNGVSVLWPELCAAENDLVVKAHRLLELGAEILVASPADAETLAGAGLLAPVFAVRE